MQNIIKILYLILFINLNFNSLAFDNFSTETLKQTADSLFQKKNYIDAKLIYDEIYFERNISSDDILLKSALINEGLKQFEWTLYYLKQYLQKHPKDDKTKGKITRIAEDNNLTGYETDDLSVILNFVVFYKIHILSSISLLLLLILIINQVKKNKHVSIIAVGIFLLALTILFQNYTSKQEAIIIESGFLMDQPSGAGNQLKKINPGHKILILDEVDVWTKILIDNEEAYLLKSKIIEL